MQYYLLHHGQAQALATTIDPYSASLTPEGLGQAERLATLCQEWDIRFLCASTMHRAQQAADAIHAALPEVMRWDLSELEDLTIDDLQGAPSPGPQAHLWPPRLLRLGHEQAWIRVMAALARIQLYAETYGLERVAILSHETVLQLLLLNWLGLDWRALDHLQLALEPGATASVIVQDASARISWLNRL
jgi:broad specificity phosphatase PhoE